MKRSRRAPPQLDDLLSHDAPPDDFRPTASWKNLRLRAALLRRVREFFDRRGFLEVETPILSADTVVDRHLDPFTTSVRAEPGKPPRRLWLQTSPEQHMKRLLAAGAEAIYQVARVFRRDERGPRHNPEFTLVEWYRTGDGPEEGMTLLSELCEAMLARGPAERLSYHDAFERHAGGDPLAAGVEELAAAAEGLGITAPESLGRRECDRDDWLDLILAERIQPRLGDRRPTILYDYPASQAALARLKPDDPRVAERFELYVAGLELANGYHELTDAAELRRRFEAINARRAADGKPKLPEPSRLLRAMEAGLPPGVGVALGFDRLVMLAAGATRIEDVIAFPLDRA
jgi:elongation factor P--(R)-beta-lysine ligase